jgi:hypothetical protein
MSMCTTTFTTKSGYVYSGECSKAFGWLMQGEFLTDVKIVKTIKNAQQKTGWPHMPSETLRCHLICAATPSSAEDYKACKSFCFHFDDF